MFALVRHKRRNSLTIVAVVLIPLLSLMIALALWPGLGRLTPIGSIPFPWLALGPISLFAIASLALIHDRSALSLERRWSARHGDDGPAQ